MQKNCAALSLTIALVALLHYSLTSPTSAVSSTNNFGSPEALWSLLIILLHMFFGFIHMWWRDRKKTPKAA